MSAEMTAVGLLLREYRLAAGLTQETLAERAGIGLRSVQAIEAGTNRPLADTVRRLAAALGLGEEERSRLLALTTPSPRQRSPTAPTSIRAYTAPGTTGRMPREGVSLVSMPRNPYKGLRAFHGEDADNFFGRTALVEELVAALQSRVQPEVARFLAVVGPSGSGKSSVVLAGLLPRLRAGALPGSAAWTYLDPIVPGAHPLEALSIALATALSGSALTALRADLDASERGLHRLASRLAGQPARHVLLVVDQAEELFTLAAEEERRQFIELLVTAVCEPRGRLLAVLTLRADFYDRPMSYGHFGRLVTAQSVAVLPLEPDELRAAIKGPAALPDVGLRFEGSLVSELLYEVREQAGALPLLQFTLEQLYARRAGRLLTEAAYHALGGVRGALARHAEATYQGLPSEEHRALARVLFLRLIEPGADAQETTRRRAALDELELADPQRTTRLRSVAEAFIAARLLTALESGGTTTLEVSHEALIREWERLGAWLHAAREDVRVQIRLSADAAEWDKRGRPADSLYRGTMLAEAQGWAGRTTPSAREEAFLKAATTEERRQSAAERERQERELAVARQAATRLRALVGGLAVFLLVTGGLAALAQANASEARHAQAQATNERDTAQGAQRLALSHQLGEQALNRLNSQYDLALLLSLQSYRLNPTAEGRVGLLPAMEAQPPGLLAYLEGHTLTVTRLAVSPDGRTLASGSADGTIRFWDLRRRRALGPPLRSATGAIHMVAFSPDGRLLATADPAGNVRLWDVGDRRPLGSALAGTGTSHTRPGVDVQVNALAFSPDSNVIAAACTDNTIRLWDTAHRRPLAFSPIDGDTANVGPAPLEGILTLAFSPNGKLLATGNVDGTVDLWDAATGAPYAPRPGETGLLRGHRDDVTGVAFSPDSKFLVSASDDTTILWDVAREQQSGPPLLSGASAWGVAFSSDATLAVGSYDGTIRLWNVRRRRQLGAPLVGHTGGVFGLAFSPDGAILASGTATGAIALWAVHQRPPATTLARSPSAIYGDQTAIYGLAVSPDGRTLAAAGGDGTLWLWNLPSERLRASIYAGGDLTHLAFSPDSRLLAVGSGGNVYFVGGSANASDVWSVYDVASGRLLFQPPAPQVGVNNVAFSPDGRLLALARADGTIQVWAVPQRPGERWHALGAPLRADPSWVMGLAISPDGRLLASGGSAGTIRLWDVARRRQLGAPLVGSADPVFALAFNRSGTLLASAGVDQTIRLWDVRRRQPVGALLTSLLQNAVAFSPDGTLLASGGGNITVLLWDVAGGRPLGAVSNAVTLHFVTDVAFTPDGTRLFAALDDGSVHVWNVDLHGWPQRACQIANRNLTQQEWRHYLPGLPYQTTCPDLPAGS